jgi:hypothetical protein
LGNTIQVIKNGVNAATAVMSHAAVSVGLIINGFTLYIIHGFFEGNKIAVLTGQARLLQFSKLHCNRAAVIGL